MIAIGMLDAAFFALVNLELFLYTKYTHRVQLPVLIFSFAAGRIG